MTRFIDYMGGTAASIKNNVLLIQKLENHLKKWKSFDLTREQCLNGLIDVLKQSEPCPLKNDLEKEMQVYIPVEQSALLGKS